MTPIGKWTWRGLGRLIKRNWQAIWPWVDTALELAKPALILAYDKAVDAQQEKLIGLLNTHGPAAVSRTYDDTQRVLCRAVDKLSALPQKWRDKACTIIEDEGNRFQRQLVTTIQNQGVAGLNALIDATQTEIRERLKAL